MRKLRLGEVSKLVQSHTACKGHSQESEPVVPLEFNTCMKLESPEKGSLANLRL